MITEQLILQNKAFADKCAHDLKKKLPKHISFDELQSAAYLGLIESAHKYNEDKGKFTTFSHYRIMGAMYDYLREMQWGTRCTVIKMKSLAEEYEGEFEKSSNIEEMIDCLPFVEQNIIIMYYKYNYNMKEIGNKLHVTKSRIFQILQKSHETLRKKLA
jgi:RNA polymerase sigma factor (sigma-70 family)